MISFPYTNIIDRREGKIEEQSFSWLETLISRGIINCDFSGVKNGNIKDLSFGNGIGLLLNPSETKFLFIFISIVLYLLDDYIRYEFIMISKKCENSLTFENKSQWEIFSCEFSEFSFKTK